MKSTTLSTRLNYLLGLKGLNMSQLGKELNVHQSVISRHLSGEREPTIGLLSAYAKFFGVSTDWLLGLSNTQLSSIPEHEAELLLLYNEASEDDKRVIQAILNKYRPFEDTD